MNPNFTTPEYGYKVHEKLSLKELPGVVYISSITGREGEVSAWSEDELIKPTMKKLVVGLQNHFMSSPHFGVPHIAIAIRNFTNVFRFGDPRYEEFESNIYHIGAAPTDDVLAGNMQFEKDGPIGCLGEFTSAIEEQSRHWAYATDITSYMLCDMSEVAKPRFNQSLWLRNPNKTKEHLIEKGLWK